MLDKFIVLLERFVVAHELIAANSARVTTTETVGNVSVTVSEPKELAGDGVAKEASVSHKELPVEGESVIDTPAAEEKPKRKKAAKAEPVPEDDLADEEPQEKKPAKKEVDLTQLRDDIKMIARHIATGESDKCNDLFDEMLEEYGVRTVTKLPDDVVAKFHKEAKALVAKYYDIED